MTKINNSTVSIIIPLRNERDYIAQCLEAILAQDYPAALTEVICVDGLSDDGTREIIADYLKQQSNFRLLDNPGRIVPSAMNIGIRAATGEIIIRVDTRSFIAPDYVSKIVHYLGHKEAAGVGGPQQAVGIDLVTDTIALALNSPFGMASPFRFVQEGQYTDTIYLGAYHRRTIERAGYFDEKFVRNQDYEFNYRVRQKVGPLYCAPDIQSTYVGRSSLRGLWRQYWQYGFWKTRTLWKHPESLRTRHLVAPGFVAALLTTALGSRWSPLRTLFLAITGLYLLANLSASLLAGRQTPVKSSLLLPIIFTIMHLAWGTGFLWGLLTLSCSPTERSRFRSV